MFVLAPTARLAAHCSTKIIYSMFHAHTLASVLANLLMTISSLTSMMVLLLFSIDIMLMTHFACSTLTMTLYPFSNFLTHSIQISNLRCKSKLVRFWFSLMSTLITMIHLISKLHCIIKRLSLDYLLTSSALLLVRTKLDLFAL